VTHLSLPPLKTLTPLLNTLPPPFVNGSISKYQKNPFSIYNRYTLNYWKDLEIPKQLLLNYLVEEQDKDMEKISSSSLWKKSPPPEQFDLFNFNYQEDNELELQEMLNKKKPKDRRVSICNLGSN
jgi:hypothetical protein